MSPARLRTATLPRLLLLTDRSQLALGRGLLRTVAECVEAGATHVVLRELDLAPERRAALAAEIAASGAQVIAAHAALPGTVGVHLPAGGRSDATGLTGRSCHTADDVARAAADGADYVTLGPFAATASKPGYGPASAPASYAGHAVPVYALGGITPANAPAALDAGAFGVAVMGAVMRAPEPAEMVRTLLKELP